MGGDAATVRCSLLALATAVYEFSAFVPDLTLEDLLDKVSKLATCSSREVVGSCLSFVAVFIQVLMTIFLKLVFPCFFIQKSFEIQNQNFLRSTRSSARVGRTSWRRSSAWSST